MTVESARSAIIEALRLRRSMTKSGPEPVPQALVEQVIAAGTWAPNHRRTDPWRFVVVTGGARQRLGDLMASRLAERLEDVDDERRHELLEKERAKPLRAPVMIAVAAEPSTDPKTIEIEEVEAVAAGVENMMLAAHALGLGAMWRTGDAAYDPAVREFLGLSDRAHIVSFLYLGYPEIVPPPLSRPNPDRFIR
ncbi:MAG TPA: nitroreductase, partial [Chloroflexota bacterium]|nr:nitroreductase [Chloroflexota bacterium]